MEGAISLALKAVLLPCCASGALAYDAHLPGAQNVPQSQYEAAMRWRFKWRMFMKVTGAANNTVIFFWPYHADYPCSQEFTGPARHWRWAQPTPPICSRSIYDTAFGIDMGCWCSSAGMGVVPCESRVAIAFKSSADSVLLLPIRRQKWLISNKSSKRGC